MSGKIIKITETENYVLQVGNSELMASGIRCYQVINKDYNVVESETTNLFKAKLAITTAQSEISNAD